MQVLPELTDSLPERSRHGPVETENKIHLVQMIPVSHFSVDSEQF